MRVSRALFRVCGYLAVCCGIGAIGAAGSLASPSFIAGPLPPPPGAPVSDLEPGAAASGDGTFIIAATSVGRGADVWVSHDGGLSYRWAADPFQNPPETGPLNGQDTDAAAAPAGNGASPPNLYATSLYTADSALAVSHDGGKTFQINQLGGTPSEDRPWLAADGACTVYMAYQNGDSGPPSREMVSRFDACQTPVQTGSGEVLNPVQSPTDPYPLGSFLAGKPMVDNSPQSRFRHRLYIPTGGCETDVPGPTFVPSTDPFDCQFARASISIAVSSDGGQSFTVHRVTDSTTHQLQIWPDELAIDAAGQIYLVWGDNRHVYLDTSTDGGATWSAPRTVDRPPALSTAIPQVAAGASGHVDIAWYGAQRAGAANDQSVMGAPGAPGAATWRVYFAKSTDGGRTFAQTAVTPEVHTGIVCTSANACTVTHSRDMFEDFGIAISPTTGRASLAYDIDQPTIQPGATNIVVGFATELAPRPGCPAATGSLRGSRLGPLRLGMTRAQARHKIAGVSTRGRRDMDFFCLNPIGIRAGYPSHKLLHALARRTARRIQGKVVLLLTANPYYALRGARPGMQLSVVAHRLRVGRGFHIGLNWWYLTPNPSSHGLLKVRHGIIEEVGTVDKELTTSRQATRRFLSSFG